MQTNRFLCGNCVEQMKKLPNHSIDMVFADPPYFMQTSGVLNRSDGTKFSGVNESWDKFENLSAYDHFCRAWLTECQRILKPNGSIWVIGGFQNIYRLGYLMQEMGFWILNEVIWTKPNAPPNFTGTRLQNHHETLLWCSPKKNAPYTFNYQTLKALNGGKQANSVWDIPICLGPERIKGEDGKKLHATQKPEALLYRVLLASTKPDDVVLDLFSGTGTTSAMAKLLGRHFIAIEKDPKYVKSARERVAKIKPKLDDFALLVRDKKPPKILFSRLLERGLLNVGDYLFTPQGKKVKIMPKGLLKYQNKVASIHQMAAIMQNKSVANGWLYWQIKTKKGLEPIDILRGKK